MLRPCPFRLWLHQLLLERPELLSIKINIESHHMNINLDVFIVPTTKHGYLALSPLASMAQSSIVCIVIGTLSTWSKQIVNSDLSLLLSILLKINPIKRFVSLIKKSSVPWIAKLRQSDLLRWSLLRELSHLANLFVSYPALTLQKVLEHFGVFDEQNKQCDVEQ